MSRDLILHSDESEERYSYDNICTQHWLEGHAPGLEAGAAWLREKAVELFREGKDSEATAMRRLAEQMLKALKPEMEARAERHGKEHPEVVEVAVKAKAKR